MFTSDTLHIINIVKSSAMYFIKDTDGLSFVILQTAHVKYDNSTVKAQKITND
jgi:hypothetical protein